MTTNTADAAATASIQAAARELKLPVVRTDSTRVAADAERSKLTYLGFLAEILEAEVDARTERRRIRRVHDAKFPRVKRLADFDLDAAPTVQPATLATLASVGYIRSGDPVVLLGDSGTGKSHLLIGLGLAACEQGLRVRYTTTAQLVNELAEAADERRLSRLVARYGRLDLLCLDELGYVQLFQILTEREEKSSIALASNLPFSEMGPSHRRPTPRVRHRRPRHLQRPHHRNRHRLLPTPRHPQTPNTWSQIKRARWGQSGLTFPPIDFSELIGHSASDWGNRETVVWP